MRNETDSYCNGCTGLRRHEVLYRKDFSWYEDIADRDNTVYLDETYEVLECLGCSTVSLRHKSSPFDPNEHESPVTVAYYPPAIYRRIPEWIPALKASGSNPLVCDLVQEIYIAIYDQSYRLAAMGIRALLESVMIDKIGDQGTFAKNLKKLGEEGFISKRQEQILSAVISVGNATIHRGVSPTDQEVVTSLNIVESITELIYLGEKRASSIKKNIPPRVRKVKGN